MNQLPIGVFDSGLGGLTVVKALREILPGESILYLGDTARVPYGTRSPKTVLRYARGCAKLLTARGIKALVIACNTASAVSLDVLRAELDLPVLGVIAPGAKAALDAMEQMRHATGGSPRIGVLGTVSTVASGAYVSELRKLSTRVEVEAQAAPLLVPLVEEGWLLGEVPRLVVERYVRALIERDARVLVLGCTHYPLLRDLIQGVADRLATEQVTVVDSAEATAHVVAEMLHERRLMASSGAPLLRLLVTDRPSSFSASTRRFLGAQAPEAELVDIVPGDG